MTPLYLVDKLATDKGLIQFNSGECTFIPLIQRKVRFNISNNGVLAFELIEFRVTQIWYTIMLPFMLMQKREIPYKKYHHKFQHDVIYDGLNLVCESNHLTSWYQVDDLFPVIKEFPKTKCVQFIA